MQKIIKKTLRLVQDEIDELRRKFRKEIDGTDVYYIKGELAVLEKLGLITSEKWEEVTAEIDRITSR